MTKQSSLQIFEEKKVRTVWDDKEEKWYFAVVDVVEVLTDSKNPTDYIKKMKKRDPQLAEGWGQFVPPHSIDTAGGKQRVNCTDTEGIFRIIQSIPSPKAEPFKGKESARFQPTERHRQSRRQCCQSRQKPTGKPTRTFRNFSCKSN